jgi:transcriptional regulator
MYIPPAFEVTDTAQIGEAISDNSFAILVSKDGNSLFASHLPFLFKPDLGPKGKLISHMARANRHWQLLNEEEEALIIFNGPHAYISPNWYVTEVAVPTWNYATIHVYGRPKLMQAEGELNAVLDETVEKHESCLPRPWIPNLSDELKASLHKVIVGFEIEITRIEGKFKFGQNRSKEDQEKMIYSLQNSGDEESMRLGMLMERNLKQ